MQSGVISNLGSRVFVVGAARSGTSFLSRCLGIAPNVLYVEESGVFRKFDWGWLDNELDHRQFFLQQLSYFSSHKPNTFKQKNSRFAKTVFEYSENFLIAPYLSEMLSLEVESDEWLRTAIAKVLLHDNLSVFLEKTPYHIYHIDSIRNVFSDAMFIHIVRNPLDAVASLIHCDWWEEDRTIAEACDEWNSAAVITASSIGSCVLVHYEKLIHQPTLYLSKDSLQFFNKKKSNPQQVPLFDTNTREAAISVIDWEVASVFGYEKP